MSIARDLASGSGIEAGEVVPHIIPGVLYPAVAGNDLDGTALGGSYTYGTAHTDGRSYYYTDIKGSKPIKDPRIGAHFGSQRYRCSSLQLLEQETAIHGANVFSMDGREWARCVGDNWEVRRDKNAIGAPYLANVSNSNNYIEVTGYFSHANWSSFTNHDFPNNIDVLIDGTDTGTQLSFETTVQTPIYNRFVDATSLKEVPVGSTTLGIHTLRLTIADPSAFYFFFSKFELIAQDTSSTANKSKIQIPSQNVVSYGKKATVSGTPHYDPFNGFTSGTDISGYIDEATSLGMSNWKVSSTWYRPFNGGRVVKWVDSSGNIKTSVTMMPPNAQNIGTTASNAIDLSSSQTNDDTINFNTSAIDHSLSEVAKTFHYREFGNGAANQGTGGSYADASMLTTQDDIAYVMDDGLTSLAGQSVKQGWDTVSTALDLFREGTTANVHLTFIGTGIGRVGNVDTTLEVAQNLPYGTHIFKTAQNSSLTQAKYWIDGVEIITRNQKAFFTEMSIHQPKKPPIPEEAVVIADYMLMADFVAQSSAGIEKISKGVRSVSNSRDMLYDETAGGAFDTLYVDPVAMTGLVIAYNTSTGTGANTVTRKLPFFGTNFVSRGYQHDTRLTIRLDGVDKDSASTKDNTATRGSYAYLTSSVDLGTYEGSSYNVADQAAYFESMDIVTPIHTSSHYQTFETPWHTELVGGDRNMEQTNLVVTADGKTWDEVTRNTSYIGDTVMLARNDQGWVTAQEWDHQRGGISGLMMDCVMKDCFVWSFDRLYCLKDGDYTLSYCVLLKDSSGIIIKTNGVTTHQLHPPNETGRHEMVNSSFSHFFKRGDYITNEGQRYGAGYTYWRISRHGHNSNDHVANKHPYKRD